MVSLLRAACSRASRAFEALHLFSQFTQLFNIAEVVLPHISCFLLTAECVLELAIVLFFREDETISLELTRGNRPLRLFYAATSAAFIYFNCGVFLLGGFDLFHSLLIQIFSEHSAHNALKRQLNTRMPWIANSGEEENGLCAFQRALLRSLDYKIFQLRCRTAMTICALLVLSLSVVFYETVPLLSAVGFLVGGAYAAYNRFDVIQSISKTPGLPDQLLSSLEVVNARQAGSRSAFFCLSRELSAYG